MSQHATITLAEALNECRRIRMDLTNAQAKLTDVIQALAAHPDSDRSRPVCEHCRLTFRGQLSLDEHLHVSHDGPLPPHWVEAERLAGIDPRRT